MTEHDTDFQPSALEFAGEVAIVTGGGSGIGRAVAHGLSRAGASIVIADLDLDKAKETVAQLANGAEAIAVQADVSDASTSATIVDAATSNFGQLTLAVNNVGVGSKGTPLADTSLDDWHRVIATTLGGAFYGMRAQLPAMLSSGGGSIVNLTSVMGVGGIARNSAYSAAKHGVIGLTKSAAIEYSGQGIRINAVAPGYIETPVFDRLTDEERATLARRHPIGRLGAADEVANLILFLLSGRASFMTGGVYLVDGGYAAGWMLGARTKF